MSKYLCKKCGREITPNMKFCKYCGTHLQVVKSICPTCHREYDESANFCPTCASRCEKKQVFEANVIEEVVKPQPVEVVKPVTNTVAIPTIKASAFTVVDEALNNKLIKKIFWILGIVNVCLVGLTFLVLALVPLNVTPFGYENTQYYTFFIFMIRSLVISFKNVGSQDLIGAYLIYAVVLLTSILTLLISELVKSIKLIKGDYKNIFLNTFTKNLSAINGKALMLIAIFSFTSMYNMFDYSVYHNINPTFIMMPVAIVSIGYVIVGMVFKHRMLQKIEPMKVVPKELLTHRIMYLVCSFMVIVCFGAYLMVIKSIKYDYYPVKALGGFYNFLKKSILGDLLERLPVGLYPIVAYVAGCAFYQLGLVPLAQIALGVFRVIGFSKQNEIQNQLYNNGGMGGKFAFMCVIMSIAASICIGARSYVGQFTTVFIIFIFLFMILLGITIAINVIEKQAKKVLKENN